MSEIKQHWQKIELNEILSISSKKFNPIGNNENKKCVELEHLSQETGKLLGYTNSSEQQSIKNSFEEGQILFGKLRPYLKKFWKAEFEGVCSSEIWVMNGKKVKNDFLFYLVQTEKFNQIANVSSGSKMPRADWNYMSEIPFDIPPLKEQEKIAEILTTWDEAITKQTELLRAKELQKKALMQKLLSGEVRFDGFSDEWEEVRLGEICKITTGKLNANAMVENGKYTFFTCARETYKINEFAFDTEALLVSGNGANVGYIHYFKGKFNAYQRTYVLDDFEHDIFLIKYLLDKYLSLQISREKNEGNTPYITLPTLTKMKLKLPSLPEQQKIAEVLSLADDEINLLKNELEELKLQKKALMQKLLTGQVRVKV
ncbi:restriction endonuclease subunit S [Arcobacter vandammei]|uniref:restriction endonuclease subunit S n=1 Tax=Arcobacter vandammei TaxID=2782243 RepID=UPI0018DFC870|nr:restriction endonuclease subunit S [Arcobacter vandammei]